MISFADVFRPLAVFVGISWCYFGVDVAKEIDVA